MGRRCVFALFIALVTGFMCGGLRAQETPPVDASAVVSGNTMFAFDLYAKLRAGEGNLFFSPMSISTALGMTYAGARGRTAEEMAKVLHIPDDQTGAHAGFGALLRELDELGKTKGCNLSTANALWGAKGEEFLPGFLKLVKDNYGGGLERLDFVRAPEESRKTINAWVEQKTEQKIKDLLLPPDITPATVLVLTNAIYFKGDWEVQFDKKLTAVEIFTNDGGKRLEDLRPRVPMMNRTGSIGYLKGEGFQAVELPYVGKSLSMVVFLPDSVWGLAAFEKSLAPDKFAEWLKGLHKAEVALTLPKFTMTVRYGELAKTLAEMGMPSAFIFRVADFSGINGKKDLFISKVIHKAFVDVNEEGTEAAAATAVIVTPGAVTRVVEFRADHPFIFLIRDNASGSILFMGRVVNPKA
jgi:serpin B